MTMYLFMFGAIVSSIFSVTKLSSVLVTRRNFIFIYVVPLVNLDIKSKSFQHEF